MKKTALYENHVALGGKIIEFCGWLLPVEYSGLVPEHNAVRNQAGLFDVSHMGEVTVKGPGSEGFVQNLVTNDVEAMIDNQVFYAQMCQPDGGVVDDLLVYKISKDSWYLVINAANVEKDFAWMQECLKGYDAELVNLSPDVSEVALQGPLAQKTLQKLTDTDLESIGFFMFKENVKIAGANCLVSRTGYTGEDGFEIYSDHGSMPAVWDAILAAGKDDGVVPCGLGCRDTLRFEATLPLYGHEISSTITPLEAGLGMFVKLDKPFIGRDALVKQKEEGLKRKVVGFELIDRGIPREGYPVFCGGVEVGRVTTGYPAPTVGKTIGLALVSAECSTLGTELEIMIRNKPAKGVVISKKFLEKKYKK